MAVPTIASVTPAQLVSDTRAQVIIAGTGFNLWSGIPVPNAGVLVFFKFGTEEFLADHIQVISATEIRCQAVFYMGLHTAIAPWTADVRVVNIDATGAPIPTEEVTKVAAVTYVQDQHLPGPTSQRSFLERAFAEMLRMLKVSIRANVALATHTDYTPEGIVVHFTTDLPAVGIVNITSEQIMHTPYDPDRDREEGQEEEYLASQYAWIRFQIVPMTDNAAEGLSLWAAVNRFGQRVRRLKVPRGPGTGAPRMMIRLELDPAPVFGFTPAVGTATDTFNCRMGPIPIEVPEVTDRVYALEDALVAAYANVELTGSPRDRDLY
jgi:hypothetical protein